MAAVQFIVPYPIVAKPTNVGAPGAKGYFYVPGTTTKKAIYASSALTTQLANPVTADGAGRFPNIYLDDATTYKIVIADKQGAVLFTQDPMTPGVVESITGPRGPAGGAFTSVVTFGAVGDGTTDDTTAIQAGIDYLDSLGGGTLYFPEGTYKITETLVLCKKLIMLGASKKGSVITTAIAGGGGANTAESTANGTALYSNWPSNGSTAADILIEHLGIKCTNGSNVGAGVYDNGGSFVRVSDCWISGFKYGVIFDQSEISCVDNCTIEGQAANGACVWLVNQDVLKPGNLLQYTNHIRVIGCQLNGSAATVDLIRDDGGVEHAFIENNYNSGKSAIRSACGIPFQIIGGEFEGQASDPILLTGTASDGTTSVGFTRGSMHGGVLSNGGSGKQVNAGNSGSWCSFHGVDFGGSSVPVSGATDGRFSFHGCTNFNANRQWTDSNNCKLWVDEISHIVKSNFAQAAWDGSFDYFNGLILCSNAAANAMSIMNDSHYAQPFPDGADFILEQSTAAGTASFVADTGVTITGPLATTARYQRLRAVKVGANSWETQLVLPNPLAPPSVASTGAITSSGGGVGYATGAGGTVTQLTSKSTGVTLNKLSGQVTMNNAALASAAKVSFVVTNSTVAATDLAVANAVSGGTANAYRAAVTAVAAGSFTVTVENITGGSLSEAPVIGFAVVKAVNA